MNIKWFTTIIAVLIACMSIAQSKPVTDKSAKDWNIQKVTIDYAVQPINVATDKPGISWVLTSAKNNDRQVAYQVKIASSRKLIDEDKADIWSSDKIKSGQSSHIFPDTKKIKSNSDYWVKVTSMNQNGSEATFITSFSTAYFGQNEWKAQWIGHTTEYPYKPLTATGAEKEQFMADTLVANRSQLLRKEITVQKTIVRARAFVTGVGFYELYINGKKVGDHVLAPAKTRYVDRILYDVFDIKDFLINGSNAIGFHLGNGWFNPDKKYQDWRMPLWGFPRAIMQLQLDYTDGSSEMVLTDKTWKAAFGPITFNSIYDGEHYDASYPANGCRLRAFRHKTVFPRKRIAGGGRLD